MESAYRQKYPHIGLKKDCVVQTDSIFQHKTLRLDNLTTPHKTLKQHNFPNIHFCEMSKLFKHAYLKPDKPKIRLSSFSVLNNNNNNINTPQQSIPQFRNQSINNATISSNETNFNRTRRNILRPILINKHRKTITDTTPYIVDTKFSKEIIPPYKYRNIVKDILKKYSKDKTNYHHYCTYDISS
jgi:hypothetical protein